VLLAPPPETVTELVTVPGGPTAFTVSEIGLPGLPAAMLVVLVHVTVAPASLQVQPVPLAALYVRPVGSVSTTVSVPVVGDVPLLLTAIVYVPVEPTVKLPVCDFAIASTGRTIVVGSVATGVLVAPPPEAFAPFVTVAGALASTLTVSEIGLPALLAAMLVVLVHVTVAPASLQVQPVPLAALYVSPVGSVSTTVTVPDVATLPLLPTAIVYVPVAPATNVPVCDFAIVSTGAPEIVVGSVAVGEFGAPPPLAVAELVSVPGAVVEDTVTPSVMAGNAPPLPAIAAVLVHVTTWPASPQVQPEPLAEA
jgi:hypothetical protein